MKEQPKIEPVPATPAHEYRDVLSEIQSVARILQIDVTQALALFQITETRRLVEAMRRVEEATRAAK